jgi:hypothetical protein
VQKTWQPIPNMQKIWHPMQKGGRLGQFCLFEVTAQVVRRKFGLQTILSRKISFFGDEHVYSARWRRYLANGRGIPGQLPILRHLSKGAVLRAGSRRPRPFRTPLNRLRHDRWERVTPPPRSRAPTPGRAASTASRWRAARRWSPSPPPGSRCRARSAWRCAGCWRCGGR